MAEMSLQEYVEVYKQPKAAEELGMHQTGISHAILAGREIYVDVGHKGKIKGAYEIKGVGRFRLRLKK